MIHFRKRIVWLLVAGTVIAMPLLLRAGGESGKQASRHAHEEALYQCSMHPQVVSSKPGDCPICGMRLTRGERKGKTLAKGASGEQGKPLYYRHPMRSDVTSPAPAKDEMGMDYIPVYDEAQTSSRGTPVPGHAEIFLSPERQQLIGVQTATAEERPLAMTIRTVGRVAYDPELYGVLSEYREAVAAQAKMKNSPLPEIRERADALVRAAALKLKLLGFSDSQTVEFVKTGEQAGNLLLSSEIAWIYADIYEYEAGAVKPGQSAQITAVGLPGTRLNGVVKSVDAVFNAATRTLRARIETQDPEKMLKPEMFVDVVIEVPLGTRLAIPEEALFQAGETQLVFVAKGEGHFEPRQIQAGHQAGGYYEVLSGLSAGEKVVRSSNFLIDSESRFRAAAQGFLESEQK